MQRSKGGQLNPSSTPGPVIPIHQLASADMRQEVSGFMRTVLWLLSLGFINGDAYSSLTSASIELNLPSLRESSCYNLLHKEHVTHVYLQDPNPERHTLTGSRCPDGVQIISPSLVPAGPPLNQSIVYRMPDRTRPWQISDPRLTEQWLRKSFSKNPQNHMSGLTGCSHCIVKVYGEESGCGNLVYPCTERGQAGWGDISIERAVNALVDKHVAFFVSARDNQIPLLAPFFGLVLSIAWIRLLVSLCRVVAWKLCAYMQFALGPIFGGLVIIITQQVWKHINRSAPVLAMVHAVPALLGGAEGPDVQRDQNGRACCVCCWDAPCNVLLQPCNHLCLCSACSERLRETQPEDLCPVCREGVNLHTRVFAV